MTTINRPFEYERVYLPPYKVADTPFYIQGVEIDYCNSSEKQRNSFKQYQW